VTSFRVFLRKKKHRFSPAIIARLRRGAGYSIVTTEHRAEHRSVDVGRAIVRMETGEGMGRW